MEISESVIYCSCGSKKLPVKALKIIRNMYKFPPGALQILKRSQNFEVIHQIRLIIVLLETIIQLGGLQSFVQRGLSGKGGLSVHVGILNILERGSFRAFK
jgi:hypothetical protein